MKPFKTGATLSATVVLFFAWLYNRLSGPN